MEVMKHRVLTVDAGLQSDLDTMWLWYVRARAHPRQPGQPAASHLLLHKAKCNECCTRGRQNERARAALHGPDPANGGVRSSSLAPPAGRSPHTPRLPCTLPMYTTTPIQTAGLAMERSSTLFLALSGPAAPAH